MSDTSSETAAVEIVQTTTRKRWTAAQGLRIAEGECVVGQFRISRGQTVRGVARVAVQVA